MDIDPETTVLYLVKSGDKFSIRAVDKNIFQSLTACPETRQGQYWRIDIAELLKNQSENPDIFSADGKLNSGALTKEAVLTFLDIDRHALQAFGPVSSVPRLTALTADHPYTQIQMRLVALPGDVNNYFEPLAGIPAILNRASSIRFTEIMSRTQNILALLNTGDTPNPVPTRFDLERIMLTAIFLIAAKAALLLGVSGVLAYPITTCFILVLNNTDRIRDMAGRVMQSVLASGIFGGRQQEQDVAFDNPENALVLQH